MSAVAWTALEAAPIGAAVLDAQDRVLAINPAAERIFGRVRADVLGRGVEELLPGAQWRPALGVPSSPHELLGRAENGEERVLELVVTPAGATDPAGRVIYVRDLTSDRRSKRELEHREAVAETVRDAMIETDTEFRIVRWNRAAEVLYGWRAEEVLGRSTTDVLRTELTDGDTERMLSDLARHGHVLTLARQRTRTNQIVEVEASVISLTAPDGTILGYVALNRDITARRRLEDRLRDTRHLEVVGRLAGGVAHDLNSLLTAILGYADLTLADRDLPARVRPDLKQVVGAAERAGELTRQLLAFSRQQVLEPQRLDVNQIIAGTLAARRRLAGRAVELVDVPARDPAPIVADRARLEQALLDVVTNAAEAMPGGGRLVTEARTVSEEEGEPPIPPGRYVRVTIADDGCGMDAATRSRALEPFFTTKRGHTGLGLSTAYGFLGQSGGHLTLEAQEGAGTTVAFYLPAAD